jgi:iron complex transport system substrate-binding protein
MKIVSLLPSATEIICALGLADSLVAVTHECDYPPCVRGLPVVTRDRVSSRASMGEIDRAVREETENGRSLYALDHEALEALRPDLIVTQALCGVCAVSEDEVRAAACMLPEVPRVLNLEPMMLREVLGSMRAVAGAAGIDGEKFVQSLEARVERVVTCVSGRARPRVALLEWLDPPFSAGHWNPELVRLAGGVDVLGQDGQPSRTLAWKEVTASKPEVIVIACCGFGVGRTLEETSLLKNVPGWMDLPAVRSHRVYVVDGSAYFSRPGPRLVDSLELLAHLLHPDAVPRPEGVVPFARLHSDSFADVSSTP